MYNSQVMGGIVPGPSNMPVGGYTVRSIPQADVINCAGGRCLEVGRGGIWDKLGDIVGQRSEVHGKQGGYIYWSRIDVYLPLFADLCPRPGNAERDPQTSEKALKSLLRWEKHAPHL